MEAKVRLDTPDDNGVTKRQRARQIAKQTGEWPKAEEFQDHPVPKAGGHLWACFWELDSGRQNNGFGPCPITWLDLHGWSRMTGENPDLNELAALRAMDRARLSATAAHTPSETGRR